MRDVLSRDEARAFYDRFGAKQDSQGFYEDAPLAELVEHADFDEAEAVFEFGCGTGRFAEGLLEHHLPLTASYRGVDLSETMVALARARVKRFEDRAEVALSDGSMRMSAPEGSIERVVCTYVLDLLSDEDIRKFLGESLRVLTEDGKLCLTGLTKGTTVLSRIVTFVWSSIHRLRPALVGGCRPIRMIDYLDDGDWEIQHRRVVIRYGIPSEVIVATPRPPRPEAA